MTASTRTRLDALELQFGGDCPICKEWPALRFTTSDADTGEQTGENRPAECPRCGKRTAATLDIIGMDFDELP